MFCCPYISLPLHLPPTPHHATDDPADVWERKDVFRVRTSPAGFRCGSVQGPGRPQSEEALRRAVHGVLHGLESLHAVSQRRPQCVLLF